MIIFKINPVHQNVELFFDHNKTMRIQIMVAKSITHCQ